MQMVQRPNIRRSGVLRSLPWGQLESKKWSRWSTARLPSGLPAILLRTLRAPSANRWQPCLLRSGRSSLIASRAT